MKRIFLFILLMIVSGCAGITDTEKNKTEITNTPLLPSATLTVVPTSTYTPIPTNTPIPTDAPLPSLKQINEDGFGVFEQQVVFGLESFDGILYAGTYSFLDGSAYIFAYDEKWENVTPTEFFSNSAVNDFHVFGEHLYLGTGTSNPPAEIWRSSDGLVWEKINLGTEEVDLNGTEVSVFFEIDGYLYATFGDLKNGAEIWRSNTGDSNSWTKVAANGFGKSDNAYITSAVKYQDKIILGTITTLEGEYIGTKARFYYSENGEDWSLLYEFNEDPSIPQIPSVKVFQDYLYATILTKTGDISAKVIRCQLCDGTDWEYVFRDKFDHIGNIRKPALIEYNDHLFFIVGNDTRDDGIEENNGLEIWRSRNGQYWIKVATSGINDHNNLMSYFENAMTLHNGKLYLGTINLETGGEVWEISE